MTKRSLYKMEIWPLAYADTQFSKFIRERDPNCRRCWMETSDDCSHFFGRGNSGTRFDPNNCVGLCRPCHELWEKEKNGAYKKFMINWLGQKEFDVLEKRARGYKNQREAIIDLMKFIKKKDRL